jgi:ligand-binding sensor domain-containing protein/signal transduction histidine kinase
LAILNAIQFRQIIARFASKPAENVYTPAIVTSIPVFAWLALGNRKRRPVPSRLRGWAGLAVVLFACLPNAFPALPPNTTSNADRSSFDYSPRVWQTDEGLPNNRVQTIAQTVDGFLWVGTSEGLARFDGVEFKPYNSAPSLRNASITALCPAADGALWIGTKTNGLIRLHNGQLSLFSAQDGLAGNNIRVLSQSRDGALWIGTSQGLSRYRDGKFQTFPSDAVTALCENQEGMMWVGTVNGLNQLREGVVQAFTVSSGSVNIAVHALWLDRQNQLWIGSDHELLCYTSGSIRAYTTLDGLSDNFVTALLEDRQNNLWVGTSSGLNRSWQSRFQTMLHDNGIPYDQVNALFEDTCGDMWIGSREGLIRLTRKPFSVITKRQGLSYNNLTSVLEDRSHRLWVGTWGGGLDEMTAEGVKVYGTTHRQGSKWIKALCEDHEGGIWAGADNNGGLFQITSQGVSHYGVANGLADATISVLHEDRESNLWIGTRLGLCRRSGGVFISQTNDVSRPVWAICEDAGGSLWFGGDAGLFRRRDGVIENLSNRRGFPSKSVSALYVDDKDTVWIGTRGEGLIRWHGKQWQRFGSQDGLYSNEILGIVEDHGWLWMTSTKGIFRVRRHDLETLQQGDGMTVPCITYGKSDGLQSIVCGNWSAPSICRTTDDRLYFATTIGLAVVDGQDKSMDLSPPPVYIDKIEVDRKPASWEGGLLRLPPGRGELDIRYTALDLRAPEKCRFKYRLDGVDSDWTDAETHRVAHYSNIAPGEYRFHVLACNKDGVWNETGASLRLQLQPHFWRTWWFRTLGFCALVSLVGGSARFATQRKMQRKLELAERRHAIERERGRIAKDIHDDLGSSLTRIMLLGRRVETDMAQDKEVDIHLKKIVSFSRHAIQAMDEIVWAVNPRNDNLDGLVGYLNEYAAQFFQDTNIRCRLLMPIASELTLGAEVRHDLFLAFKEALTNVLKHSGASEVHVQVSNVKSTVNVMIDDNGCGFDLNHGTNGSRGNGLLNMRKRMDAVGGQMEIVSAPGHGTRLQFTVHVSSP